MNNCLYSPSYTPMALTARKLETEYAKALAHAQFWARSVHTLDGVVAWSGPLSADADQRVGFEAFVKAALAASASKVVARVVGCTKCKGTGFLPQFAHVDGGVCYRCGGGR